MNAQQPKGWTSLDATWSHFLTQLGIPHTATHLGDQHLPGFVLGAGGEKTDQLFLTCPVEMLDDQMIHRAGMVAVVTGQSVLVAAGAPRQRGGEVWQFTSRCPEHHLTHVWRYLYQAFEHEDWYVLGSLMHAHPHLFWSDVYGRALNIDADAARENLPVPRTIAPYIFDKRELTTCPSGQHLIWSMAAQPGTLRTDEERRIPTGGQVHTITYRHTTLPRTPGWCHVCQQEAVWNHPRLVTVARDARTFLTAQTTSDV